MEKALIDDLAKQAEQRKYSPGEIIVRQDGRADAFYVLTAGTVDVIKRTDSGETQPGSSLTAPAFFGEMGLMEEGRRTATIRAAPESPVEVLVIPKQAFREFVDASEMMADEISALMQRHRISDSLTAALGTMSFESQEELAAQAQVLTFSQGDTIICQGDPAEYFYILTKGRVEVLHQREDGRTYLINFQEPGEYFGEIGLLQERPRSATVVRAADQTVEVLAFERNVLKDLLGDSLENESAIAQEMARRLARQVDTQED